MKTFVMLVGLSGSGKSSYRESIAEYTDVVLSTDMYIEEYARLNGKTYKEVFHDQIKNAQNQFNHEFDKAIKEGKNIILDQTNLTANARRKKMARIPKEYKKIAVFFNVDENVVLTVNEERVKFGRNLPKDVLENQIKSLEAPSKEEGFDQIIVIER